MKEEWSLLMVIANISPKLRSDIELRRNPIENRAISGFSGQKSLPE